MQIIHFPTLADGTTFVVDGEAFTKRTQLTFTDMAGIEHYIDPLFDAKLGKVLAGGSAEASPDIDTSAKVVKSESEQ